MAHEVIPINPADIHIQKVDFTEELPYDFNITVTVTCVDTAGNGADSIVASSSASEMEASITISGAENGQDYLLGVVALGDVTGAAKSKVLELRCRANGGPF